MWTSFIGFMASGKSTVVRRMARATGLPALDLDAEIEKVAGRSIPEIFARGGEAEFRRREIDALRRLDPARPLLLATGGGIVDRLETRDLLRQRGVVVWLDAAWEVLRQRIVDAGTQRRPMVGHLGWDGMKRLYVMRLRRYAQVADFRLRTDRLGAAVTATTALSRGLLWQSSARGGRP